ncbi:hypothetical protein [Calothrix rhizosoleniae]|nr:hypothetical protein [Calothrix rhizosoleniae]
MIQEIILDAVSEAGERSTERTSDRVQKLTQLGNPGCLFGSARLGHQN